MRLPEKSPPPQQPLQPPQQLFEADMAPEQPLQFVCDVPLQPLQPEQPLQFPLNRSRKKPLNSGADGVAAIADIRTRLYIEKPNEGIWEGYTPCREKIKAPD